VVSKFTGQQTELFLKSDRKITEVGVTQLHRYFLHGMIPRQQLILAACMRIFWKVLIHRYTINQLKVLFQLRLADRYHPGQLVDRRGGLENIAGERSSTCIILSISVFDNGTSKKEFFFRS